MRARVKRLAALLLALAPLALPGCTLSVYNNYRDVGSLLVVQALGIDSRPGGVTLSAATGADASGREPVRLKASAGTLEAALEAIEAKSGAGRAFFAGTGAIVLGPAAAGEAARWLDAVARSKDLRLDTELYVIKNTEAAALLTGEDAPEDVFAALDALDTRLRTGGPAPAPTCADAARSLLESGAALAAAIELLDGEPVGAGFAVLGPDSLAGWLTGGAALGAGLFLGGPGTGVIELDCGAAVELAGADIGLEPVWDGGAPASLRVNVSVRAGVIEAPAGLALDSAGGRGLVEGELAGAVEEWVGSALGESVALGADFLGLGRELQTRYPGRFDAALWPEALSRLDCEVEVTAKILNVREYPVSPFGEGKA